MILIISILCIVGLVCTAITLDTSFSAFFLLLVLLAAFVGVVFELDAISENKQYRKILLNAGLATTTEIITTYKGFKLLNVPIQAERGE